MLVTFNNPIIPGFAPYPSIIYHEESDTYFVVNSSFHVFPAIPIYASKDLQCWTQIGNVLNRREQVPLEETTTNVVKLDSAGLAVYKDSCRHASLYFDYSTSSVVLSILNWVKDEAAVIKNTAIERPSNIKFKIKTTGEAYTFFCRPREGDWAEIGTMDSIEMTARGFTGPIVGIFAHAKGNAQGQWAVFKNFEQNDGRRGIIHRVL